MGLIRKMASVSTLGAVDFRSDRERTARYTKQTRNAVRAQTAQQAALEQQRRQAAAQPPHQAPPPPGWYQDPRDPSMMRWWDGATWTDAAQPRR